MQHRIRLIGLFLLLALAVNTTFAGVDPTDPTPPSNCQLPAPSVTLDYVTPSGAQISWTPVPGAYTYRASLTDLTQNTTDNQFTNSSSVTYNSALIIPGHEYNFVVTPYCGPDDPGTQSMVLKFTAPIIVIVDIVERGCNSLGPTTETTHLLPAPSGQAAGEAVGFDLQYYGGLIQFAVRARTDGNVSFERVNDSSLDLECAPVQNAITGCSLVTIKSADASGSTVVAEFIASALAGNRYFNVQYLAPGAELLKCGVKRRGLVAPSGVGMDGVAGATVPQDTDAGSEAAQTSAGTDITPQTTMNVLAMPNPFSNNLELRFELPISGAVQVSLTDITGRQVYREHLGDALPAGIHNSSIPGTALPTGVYILHVHSAQGVVSCRVVKQ